MAWKLNPNTARPIEVPDSEADQPDSQCLECPDCWIRRSYWSGWLHSWFCIDCGYFEGSELEWLVHNGIMVS